MPTPASHFAPPVVQRFARALGAAALAAAAATGAPPAWAAPAAAPAVAPTAERMAATPAGTVSTYQRRSSGSLGAYDGPVVWTLGQATWQGREVVAATAQGLGTSLHDPGSLAMMAWLDTAGQPVVSYAPPLDYRWPLQVGQRWTSEHTMTLHATGRTMPLRMDWEVQAWEEIVVPAGRFEAFRIHWVNQLGETETRWVAPQAGIETVKRHVERPASHPQGPGVLDAELVSRRLPGR